MSENETRPPEVETRIRRDYRSPIYDESMRSARSENPNYDSILSGLMKARADGDMRATYALACWYLHGKRPVIEQSYETALDLLREAGRSNGDAAYDLAICYEQGYGTEVDKGRALRWYMQAALLGHAEAHYDVGRCFYFGIGTKASTGFAQPWLQKADELGVRPFEGRGDDVLSDSKPRSKNASDLKRR